MPPEEIGDGRGTDPDELRERPPPERPPPPMRLRAVNTCAGPDGGIGVSAAAAGDDGGGGGGGGRGGAATAAGAARKRRAHSSIPLRLCISPGRAARTSRCSLCMLGRGRVRHTRASRMLLHAVVIHAPGGNATVSGCDV